MEQYLQIAIGALVAFFLAAVNFRLGVLDEIKRELQGFKKDAYGTFISKETCELKRQACDHLKQKDDTSA